MLCHLLTRLMGQPHSRMISTVFHKTEALSRAALAMTADRISGISSYGDCKGVVAVGLESSQQHEYTWTALILQYARSGRCRQAFQLYADMQKAGVEPSSRTYVGLLKACSSLQDLDKAKWVHSEVIRGGFESDIYVGNMLVDVYAKCRNLVNARQAFENMPRRDVVSWTAMILGYAQMNKGEEALQLYTRMQRAGVAPNDRTYVSALKACSKMAESGDTIETCLQTVRCIHEDVIKGKFESDVFVGTMLVDAYAKCGNLEDARRVFETIPHRDVVAWNAMILGYAQMDMGAEALALYTRMQKEGVVPDCRTYLCTLKACSSLAELGERNEPPRERCLQTVRAIHADMSKGNFESAVFVRNMLVDVYAKCGSLEDARHVFEKMTNRDVVSWNAMILGYAQMNMGEEALQLYTRMQQEGVVPDNRTYVSALKACSSLAGSVERNESVGIALRKRCLETVKIIHANVVRGKFESDAFVGNMLVDVYAKCGSLGDARSVFEKIPHRDVVSWNAMILGYSQMDQGEVALELYTRMQQEGVIANDRTYVSALKACSSLADLEERHDPDQVTVRERCLSTVKFIHINVLKQKFESDVFVGTMLVDAYTKCCSVEDARHVFERMHHRDVVSWTAMIMGYVQMDKGDDALKLFARMQQECVVPNERTYVSALQACGSVAGLEKGKEIHAQILKAGLESAHPHIVSSLVDMYAKCGSMVDAQLVFDEAPQRGIMAWSALISGYAHQGESDIVFDLFKKMKHEDLRPDGITFLGVLTVCSHVGLVEKGQQYFEAMSTDYGITPTIKHYTCVVDLLGRAGHLVRAMEMVKKLPFQPHNAVWNSLLGACRKWKNVAVGREAFECAVRLDKNDAAAYVLMSNIYSAADMRGKAKEIQAMRVRSRAWKQPGRSWWMDRSGTVHVFVAGDKGHPESKEIYAKLGDLLLRMKKAGYIPHLESVLRDIPDDQKEGSLCGHSEKLAIVYALLKTAEGTIRVAKNLRVCEDCHRATALISKIEKRTIICRDASRFHVFQDGRCSCGDYW